MSLTVDWELRARATIVDHLAWPASRDVAAEVARFAATLAPSLPSGAYRFRRAGYLVQLRVDRTLRSVLVLGIYRVG
jgi:hypothetical protein